MGALPGHLQMDLKLPCFYTVISKLLTHRAWLSRQDSMDQDRGLVAPA